MILIQVKKCRKHLLLCIFFMHHRWIYDSKIPLIFQKNMFIFWLNLCFISGTFSMIDFASDFSRMELFEPNNEHYLLLIKEKDCRKILVQNPFSYTYNCIYFWSVIKYLDFTKQSLSFYCIVFSFALTFKIVNKI